MTVGDRLLACAALAGCIAASGASADPAPSGWYGAIDLGANLRQDGASPAEFSELGARPAALRFHTNSDFAGFGRVGYKVSPHIRVELEAGWRTAKMLSIVDEFPYSGLRPPGSIFSVCSDAPITASVAPTCGAPAGGVDAWTMMGNAYLDLRPWRRVHPFVGAGVGVARVHLQTKGRFWGQSAPLPPPDTIVIDDADWRAAYQAIGGLTMRINDHLSADLDYHFIYSGPHRWNTTTFSNIQLGRLSGRYENHTLSLGLRYLMSARRPPLPGPSAAQ